MRAEEECLILDIGTRHVEAGLAGDATPQAIINFGPHEQRRSGDYRQYHAGHDVNWRKSIRSATWGGDYTLWELDLRKTDLGLVADRIERAIRDGSTKQLLLDSRPRKVALVLPTGLPSPLLSVILDTLFNVFQAPTVSLMSSPMLVTVAAGLRAALVVDIGWAETTITAIYEYREVLCRRSVRAGKFLSCEVQKLLAAHIDPKTGLQPTTSESEVQPDGTINPRHLKLVSFEEVEDIMVRLVWCKRLQPLAETQDPSTLPVVQEAEEYAEGDNNNERIPQVEDNRDQNGSVCITLSSTEPPTTISLPFQGFADPCEVAFLGNGKHDHIWDDEELPLQLLIYRSLLQLPLDVRSICMSRIIFTGGVSHVPGLKSRLVAEVQQLVQRKSWDAVEGSSVMKPHSKTRLASNRPGPTEKPIEVRGQAIGNGHDDASPPRAAHEQQVVDPIDTKLNKEANRNSADNVKGSIRAVSSMGAWSGASLLSQLKIPAVSVLDREQWIQYGLAGPPKSGENTAGNRQSMAPGGIRAGDRTSWTLGAFA